MITTVRINDTPHQFDAWVPPGLDAEPWDRLEHAYAALDEARAEMVELKRAYQLCECRPTRRTSKRGLRQAERMAERNGERGAVGG